jgi:predicted hydrolase (HD superfamily)
MEALAAYFQEDEREWGLVGLLHDLDHDDVKGDMSRHGILAAEMLEGRLSREGLHAIMAHDHRTGVEPTSMLDESLIFADSFAVLIEDRGLDASADEATLDRALREESRDRPWISENIQAFCDRRGVTILQIMREL